MTREELKQRLNPNPDIRQRPIRFIMGLFMLGIVVATFISIRFPFSIILAIYPGYQSLTMFFQSFGYDPFNKITNTPPWQ